MTIQTFYKWCWFIARAALLFFAAVEAVWFAYGFKHWYAVVPLIAFAIACWIKHPASRIFLLWGLGFVSLQNLFLWGNLFSKLDIGRVIAIIKSNSWDFSIRFLYVALFVLLFTVPIKELFKTKDVSRFLKVTAVFLAVIIALLGWMPRIGKMLETTPPKLHAIEAAYIGKGNDFVRTSGHSMYVHDAATGAVKEFKAGRAMDIAAASQDGKWIASGHGVGDVRDPKNERENFFKVWNVSTGQEVVFTLPAGENSIGPPTRVEFTPDSQYLIASNRNRIQKWRLSDGTLVRSATAFADEPGSIYTIRFSPDGNTIVAAWTKGTNVLLDAQLLNVKAVLRLETAEIGAFGGGVFSHDGKTIYTPYNKRSGEKGISATGYIAIWDAKTYKLQKLQLAQKEQEIISGLATANHAPRLVTGGSAGKVRLWDISRAEEAILIKEWQFNDIKLVKNVAINSAGTEILVVGYDNRESHLEKIKVEP